MLSNRHNGPKRSKSGKEVGNKLTKQDKTRRVIRKKHVNNASIFCRVWHHKPNKRKPPHHVTPVAEENKKDLEFRSTKTNKDNNNKIIENHHTARTLISHSTFLFSSVAGKESGFAAEQQYFMHQPAE
jgi:hypothetical protein